jgi:ribosome-binding protein aMBF1 (putative translation factor)
MAHPTILNDQVWCPLCKNYAYLLKIRKAAKLADVSCKTIYRYVEDGKVHSIKIAGSTIRICSSCLLKQGD